MRHLAIIATVSFLALRALAIDLPPPVTPIVLKAALNSEGDSVVVINNRQYDLEGVSNWLSDASNRFGRKDPVIIQVAQMEEFVILSKVAAIALDFYDDVFLTIPTYDRNDPWLFLRYTSSERPFPYIPWGIDRKE